MNEGENDFLARNPGKTLTQGHRWIGGYCDNILLNAYLGGGTLFDWWTTHVAKVLRKEARARADGQAALAYVPDLTRVQNSLRT